MKTDQFGVFDMGRTVRISASNLGHSAKKNATNTVFEICVFYMF